MTLPLVSRAQRQLKRTAVVEAGGSLSYADLLDSSARCASGLLDGADDLRESRVAYRIPAGAAHVAVQWGIWRAGGVAVPLSPLDPPAELDRVLADSGADTLVTPAEESPRLRALADRHRARLADVESVLAADSGVVLPDVRPERPALILYTSGTTGRPKGVVSTHGSLQAQITTLVEAWQWRPADRILHVLPLHHVHGIVNALACALWSGAACEFLPRFDAERVWQRLAGQPEVTLMMGVPTMYHRLVEAWEAAPPERRGSWSAGAARLRLAVSGSAALPVPVFQRWREITGQELLERYGMTEIGMALGNPLHGRRRAGFVGTPLPGVELRLVDESGAPVPPGAPGEIEVRGPGVFRDYWRRRQATRRAFRDGWFRTGDVAVVEGGAWRILGRRDTDIIKTGGHKVSALEIERVLARHPAVRECAVVGLPDVEWGERVAVAVVAREGACVDLEMLRSWAGARLARHKLPSRFARVVELPRNEMGKVSKPRLVRQLVRAAGKEAER